MTLLASISNGSELEEIIVLADRLKPFARSLRLSVCLRRHPNLQLGTALPGPENYQDGTSAQADV
jgi:hypothetical protein